MSMLIVDFTHAMLRNGGAPGAFDYFNGGC